MEDTRAVIFCEIETGRRYFYLLVVGEQEMRSYARFSQAVEAAGDRDIEVRVARGVFDWKSYRLLRVDE